ncbi:DUF4259 domain-containing protein [Spirillospora sp. NPDC048911]|uniref:DUF4259 domain-containing protein n=1 Tax=Spirillospora sp. NPDC048911 TaxID=3364527 RepID=UPI003717A8C9
MGTWGAGPFDNDIAADFASDVDAAAGDQRAFLIQEALEAAVTEEGPLNARTGDVAVAAAAIVAAQCPGGEPVDPVYGTKERLPPLPTHLRRLAVLALDRVIGPDSELPELWAGTESAAEWRIGVYRLQSTLSGGAAS